MIVRTVALVILIATAGLLAGGTADAQDQLFRSHGRFESSTGIPRALYFQKRGPYSGSPESKARAYLAEQVKSFRLDPSLSDLLFMRVAESPMGYHVRFQQTVHSVPVYRSDIVVTLDRNDVVVFTTNSYKPGLELPTLTPALGGDAALRTARAHLKVTGKLIGEESATLMVHAENPGRARLAYRVVVPTEEPLGDWEVFVDAISGEVFSVTDMAEYRLHGHEHGSGSDRPADAGPPAGALRVNGSGLVFDPDPLTSDIVPFGTAGYVDGNDADTPQLNGARVQVTLPDITFTGLVHELKGPHVQIRDFESPTDTFTTPAHQDSFRFTRSQQAFEEVMVYYHIDKAQRHIKSLGFTNIQNLSIWADPHGLNGADNSHYVPSSNRIAFGEGGIDDAEDADVIWHEYGHAIHYGTNPSWGGGEARHIGEGFGDYWAGSYSRSGWPAGADTVFNWDGRSPTGALRPLNNPAGYPRNGVASQQIHAAGQIWSSVLMLLWADLGREVMDKLVLQSHFLLGANPTMRDNACAIIQADRSLYGGAHVNTLLNRFISRGFLRVDIEFVIDDTGSMHEEIGGVRNALTSFLAGFAEDTCLVFQLTTFKDNVTTRNLTLSLSEIRSQVASLSASGGADCPEASVQALEAIKDTVRQGGVVLLATDADPHTGTNLGATISNLRARGIRVNVLLSGSCSVLELEETASRPSVNDRAVAAAAPADRSIGPDGERYRRAPSRSDTLVLGDGDFVEVSLPFPFPFGGMSFNSVFVSSEGCLTFGEGSTASYASEYGLFAGPRRIAGFWADLNPPAGGTITAAAAGSDFEVTYSGVPLYYYEDPVTVSIRLRPDGTFRISYGALAVSEFAAPLVGFSSGRNAGTPPLEVDLSSAAQPIGSTAAGTTFEYFWPDTFDLSGVVLEFSANTYNPPTGGVTGMLFNDRDADGSPDPGEEGLAGWTVTLSGGVSRITTSDSLGQYEFLDVPAGNYDVVVSRLFGWTLTHPPFGFHSAAVDSGAVEADLNFGFYLGSGISGYVFYDADSNGTPSGAELGINDWKIVLTGPRTDSAYTAGGFYGLSDLPPGTYTLTPEARTGWSVTAPAPGTWTVVIDSAGSSVIDRDFGLYARPAALGGTLFHDRNGDGVIGPTDRGLAGRTVYVSGPMYAFVVTDSAGRYEFTDLIPGLYFLNASPGVGWLLTSGWGAITLAPGEARTDGHMGTTRLRNSVESFSLLAAETGGFFAYVPEVNSGAAEAVARFENIAYNIVQGGISKSIGLANPPDLPAGGTVLVTIEGSNTNFQAGAPAPAAVPGASGAALLGPAAGSGGGGSARTGTNVIVTGGGVTVHQVSVLSPTTLVAEISVDPAADQTFRDIVTVTDFGGGVFDTSRGLGTLRITAAPTAPTVLGITPYTGIVAETLSVIVSGMNTSFSDSSMPDLGSGIAVLGVTAISPVRLQATIVIDEDTDLGFRDVVVSTGGETATESVPGPFLVMSEGSDIAVIASVSPQSGAQGDGITLAITGSGTNFDSSLSEVTFSGSGIAVQAVRVFSPTHLEADILIDSTAPPGYRDVFVTTGPEIAAALSAFNVSVLTDVPGGGARLPERYALGEAYPNPFNPSTTIGYELPEESRVTLTVYTLLGQVVRVLVDGIEPPGYRSVLWNAGRAASGVYLYRLEAAGLSGSGRQIMTTRKLILMK